MKLSAIDLNLLVALDALLSERNVTRAAARLGRSQPATSQALNRARELFDDPLLVRVGGKMELTARARSLAPKLQRLLRELGAVLDAQKDFDPASIEDVSIGATDYVGFVLLPHFMQAIRESAPNLNLRLRTVEGPEPLEPVQSGLLDVALGTFPQVPVGLRTETLFEEEFVCVRRKSRGTPARMSLDEFSAAAHVLVVSPWTGQGPVDQALARVGRSRRIVAHVPQFLVAPSLIASTDLILTTGRRIADKLAPSLGLQIFAPPVALEPFKVRMIWHPRSESDRVGKWLRALLRASATRLR
ncbi:MAG TPA: LysR family transcriptional regulator [Polyangiaceae bacterium]|nr:LysR family transcriptional regulator [Polyangiaceae bacterium]